MPKEIYIDENGNERILSSSPSALSGLLDTDITTPSANQVLSYDGSKWGNSTLTTSDISDFENHNTTNPFEFYKIGHIVVCHIDTGNINFKSDNKTIDATIPSAYRPSAISYYITKVYNGSYVECSVRFNTNGTVLITDTGNSAIPSIQVNYLQQQYFTYFA